MEKLATIQQVKNIRHCPNSENLDLVQVLGWQVVTKRGEYLENDLAIYIVIDTILPEIPEFEFLRNKNFRIKPIHLRGQESAGIVFPLNILGKSVNLQDLVEGFDVTDILSIKHYEKPIPPELAGIAKGGLPGFLIMTDELNLRTYPDAVPELYGRPYYITRKDDGSSGTYFVKNGEFGVCSRRIQLEESESNGFWKIAKKYNIENMIKTHFPNQDIAIQGEVVGPSIQDNHLGLNNLEFHFFNIFDIGNRHYLDYKDLIEFQIKSNIPMVNTICEGTTFGYNLEELLELSNKQNYSDKNPAEGIVIRPKETFRSFALGRAWSGKVLNTFFEEEKNKKKK